MWTIITPLLLSSWLIGASVSRTIQERVEYLPPTILQVGTGRGYHKAADLFRGSLNESADPCDDFFEFSCGRWVALNEIPEDLTSYGHFSEIREKVNREMKDLYEEKEESSSKAINMVKKFYSECMSTEKLNEQKSTAIIADIEKFGYWPIVYPNKWVEADFDLSDLMINVAQARALDVFVDIYVSQDQRNVTRRLVHFDQGSLGLGSSARDYYLNDTKYAKQLNAYERLMNERIGLLVEDAKTGRSKEEITTEVKEIIAFEKKLAEIMVSEDDRRNFTRLYNLYHLSDLKTLIPIADWEVYFRSLMPFDLHDYLNSDPEIIVNEPEFFGKLNELLRSTDKRILANYVFWRYTGSWSLQLDDRFEDVAQNFLKNFIGKQTKSPRWKDCNSAMGMRFAHASGAMYVRKHFNEKDRTAAEDMVNDIRHSFKIMLEENQWMDPATKEYALKKAHEMLALIGFADIALNNKELDEYYEKLVISENDGYAMLVHKYSIWAQQKAFRRLLEVVDRKEFSTSASTVNAFYSSVRNEITFPAAILQAPFFDSSFPKAVNYGGIGSVIGHEISHAYDDQGSQFDAQGNLHNWWSSETQNMFKNLTKCIVDQYGAYEVAGTGGMKINGILTQGENIADNGGIRTAYRAYRAYIKKQGQEEKRLPGYETYTNDQIFFIAYAQTWCGRSKPEAAIRQLLIDPHSPMRFRVNGVLQNQPEFGTAFRCGANANMAPAKRCRVW
ncbi:Neprilysin-1 [Aphelenchoides besseyi]|nr:Neprilysin-1 [Aphelenchoides besseyi]KAI6221562.1 Neprilysin-1 [Aphelenchoides besseyi]